MYVAVAVQFIFPFCFCLHLGLLFSTAWPNAYVKVLDIFRVKFDQFYAHLPMIKFSIKGPQQRLSGKFNFGA